MREIALDTETTGLSPKNGDRVVEIGCVELINHMPTGEPIKHILIHKRLWIRAQRKYTAYRMIF